ncbi:PEP/pyruvate-binding domain-containing protein, partial [Candidatus Parcubacteria bacterium]|nr:PEP/pyruvate-binding domain-containing protein [Candidatus Parcubacteria bacterium]
MINLKISVPQGFVVLSSAFDKFLTETDLGVEINSIINKVNYKDINSVEGASVKIKDLINDVEFPEDIGKEIKKEFKKLKVKYVAVRSSATAEDSSVASWAGELESYLNVTQKNLLESVRKCWSSLFTPRAIFYRFEKELNKQKISVAVVIQKMVQSEVSGICFTVHPVTEDMNQMVIEAGYGLGEAIVGGQI